MVARHLRHILTLVCVTVCINYLPAQSFFSPASPAVDLQYPADIQKYSLEVDLYPCFTSPFPKSFPAKLIVNLSVKRETDILALNATGSSLGIDSVGLNGIGFTHRSDTLYITLDRTYHAGESAVVAIFYHHRNVNDNGFYAFYGTIFTDSPPEGARKWMPCHDTPSDKATWELKAIVKSPGKLVSNGLPVTDPVVMGDSILCHWRSDIPIATYLIAFSGRINFETHTRYWTNPNKSTDSIPVMIWYKPGENYALIDSMIGPLTDFYSSKFGAYPFEKIGFATLNTQFPWGGMENQTIVHLRPNGYADLDLIAHEHAHQWFGDLVTCGTWADIWLNEGFGTYLQNLWVEHYSGRVAFLKSMTALADYYLRSGAKRAIFQPDWAVSTPAPALLYDQAVTYNKSACVLHMLREVMGDSLFFAALRSYISDPSLRYGTAVTSDFIRHVNTVAGTDYNWFFSEWVYGADHPTYEAVYQVDSTNAGSWKLTILLRQTQTTTALFTMPVEWKIRFSGDSDTLVRVMNEKIEQEYIFTFNQKPLEVWFDPDNRIILKKATVILSISPTGNSGNAGLRCNFPNPFADHTQLCYTIKEEGLVVLTIFDESGRMIDQPLHQIHTPGEYRLNYRNPDLKEGIYIARLESGTHTDTIKMVLRR